MLRVDKERRYFAIDGAQDFRDPVAWNIRRHCQDNRINFKDVAAKSGIKEPRVYAIMEGKARMAPVEFGAIAKALEQPMEFFLPDNS